MKTKQNKTKQNKTKKKVTRKINKKSSNGQKTFIERLLRIFGGECRSSQSKTYRQM
jgi:hypothetical protein